MKVKMEVPMLRYDSEDDEAVADIVLLHPKC